MREDAFNEIINSLENESEKWWTVEGTCFVIEQFRRKDGLSIRLSVGLLGYMILDPDELRFTFMQKMVLHTAIKECKANKILLMAVSE